jgi:hypothetical protein
LAAATLGRLTGHAASTTYLQNLAIDLRDLPEVTPSATIAELAAIVEQIDGVRFTDLVMTLAGDLDTAQQALDDVLGQTQMGEVARWEPILWVVQRAVEGDPEGIEAMGLLVEGMSNHEDWGALVRVLQRIVAGERDADQLTAGLYLVDTTIVKRALAALAGRVQLTPPTSQES